MPAVKKPSAMSATLCLCLCAAPAAWGQQDIPGSKDHPLITRYPGAVITNYITKDYDEFILPVAPVDPGRGITKSQRLEGKITRISYAYPESRSATEVFRNYETALKRAGFQSLLTCGNEACGYARFHMTSDRWDTWYGAGDWQFSGKLSQSGSEAWVSLHVGRGAIYLDVIETKAMDAGLVVVNAAALAGAITQTGHASVYGIYFDTGKADVKPESAPALKEVAGLLQQNPRLRVHVVGHTDSTGDFAMNMELSRRRAEAVVKVLTSSYAVPADRLRPHGNGPLAPVASNRTEEGRAKNRRVELVEQ